jgi:CO/xanthine dehydrogenase FAD-binding subunit
MRALVSEYSMIEADSLRQVLDILTRPTPPKVFAGGTDLMVLFESGKLAQKNFLSLHRLQELKGIHVTDEFIDIKALTTFDDIKNHIIIKKEFPLLAQAASEIGAWAIQNRATIAGNIINASPAADSPPALLCYDAQIELCAKDSTRWIDYCQFHYDYKKMHLKSNELLTTVRLQRPKHTKLYHQVFHKVGTRRYQAISKVSFAGLAQIENQQITKARLAWGAVAPYVKRTMTCERMLEGKHLSQVDDDLIDSLIKNLQMEIAPIDDIRSTADYRRKVAANLLTHFLKKLKK